MNQKKAGVLLSYGQTALSTLISLTYTPVMLRLLGQSEYGLYTLVNGFVSNLSLLSFGMGSAYMRYYSRAEVQDGEEGVARINGMFMTIFFVISLLCLLTGGVLVANVKNIFAANLTAQELDTAKILMALLVVNIAVSFPASVFFSYITAKERFLFQRLVSMLRTVLNPIVMLPLLLMGFGSVALVMVTLILTAVSDAVSIWYCIKKLHMRITFGKFDFGLLRDMAGFSFFIFIISDMVYFCPSGFGFFVGGVVNFAAFFVAAACSLSMKIPVFWFPSLSVIIPLKMSPMDFPFAESLSSSAVSASR